jgi:hypothetical protein
MSLLAQRQAIVDDLKAALPGVTVVAHRGRFDSAAEIQRFAVKAPQVLVACVGFKPVAPGGGLVQLRGRWLLFVITKDVPQLERDAGALALAEAIERRIEDNTWGLDNLSAPTDIDARNLYAGQIDKLGVALWAVTFDQVDSSPATDEATLGVFATFHQDIDVAPADGQIEITETDTLPQ